MLPINHPFVRQMQNPVRMVYRRKGPPITVYGPETKNRYRFAGRAPYTWVDERDVVALINSTKNPGSLFRRDGEQKRDDDPLYEQPGSFRAPNTDRPFEDFLAQAAGNTPQPTAEEVLAMPEEEFNDVVEQAFEAAAEEDVYEADAYNFTEINGVGVKAMEFILDSGITTLEELQKAGLDFLSSMPYTSDDKAKDILAQIKELLEKQE